MPFHGAHEVPPEFRDTRADYIRTIVEEMIPAVAAEKLARWCDVFCRLACLLRRSQQILEAWVAAGLSRAYTPTSSARAADGSAARVGARSADHLVHVSEAGMQALATGGVTATLLPSAASPSEARAICSGPPADRTFDPGSAGDRRQPRRFLASMPFAMSLACFAMGMTFEEARRGHDQRRLVLDVADTVGSLEPGKLADVVVARGRHQSYSSWRQPWRPC